MISMLSMLLVFAVAFSVPMCSNWFWAHLLGSHYNPGRVNFEPHYRRLTFAFYTITFLLAIIFGLFLRSEPPPGLPDGISFILCIVFTNFVLQPLSITIYSEYVNFLRPPPVFPSIAMCLLGLLGAALMLVLSPIWSRNAAVTFTVDLTCVLIITTAIRSLPSVLRITNLPIATVIAEAFLFMLVTFAFVHIYLPRQQALIWSMSSGIFYFLLVGGGLLFGYLETMSRLREYPLKFGKYYQSLLSHQRRILDSQIASYAFLIIGLFGGIAYAHFKKLTQPTFFFMVIGIAFTAMALYLIYSLIHFCFRMANSMYFQDSIIIEYSKQRFNESKAVEIAEQLSTLSSDNRLDFELEKAFASTELRANFFWHSLHNAILATICCGIVIWLRILPQTITMILTPERIVIAGVTVAFILCQAPFAVGQYKMRMLLTSNLTGEQLRSARQFLDNYCPLVLKPHLLSCLFAPSTAGGALYALFKSTIKL